MIDKLVGIRGMYRLLLTMHLGHWLALGGLIVADSYLSNLLSRMNTFFVQVGKKAELFVCFLHGDWLRTDKNRSHRPTGQGGYEIQQSNRSVVDGEPR